MVGVVDVVSDEVGGEGFVFFCWVGDCEDGFVGFVVDVGVYC